jgi:hypothetical protein
VSACQLLVVVAVASSSEDTPISADASAPPDANKLKDDVIISLLVQDSQTQTKAAASIGGPDVLWYLLLMLLNTRTIFDSRMFVCHQRANNSMRIFRVAEDDQRMKQKDQEEHEGGDEEMRAALAA